MDTIIAQKYPNIAVLLSGTVFDRDSQTARVIANSDSDLETQKAIMRDPASFQLGDLGSCLGYYTYFGGQSALLRELEEGLGILIGSLGHSSVSAAYRDKLLACSRQPWEDTAHEVAVATRASRFFDAGTLELEEPLPGSSKNTDVYGKFNGGIVRIEVTALHEDCSPAIDCSWIDLVKSAEIASGFRLTLRRPLSSKEMAEEVKHSLELLHAQYHPDEGTPLQVEGHGFEWDRGVFRNVSGSSAIETLDFDFPTETREVVNPCRTRRVTPRIVEDNFPNPPQVISMMPEGMDHNDNPVSGKVRQIIENKLDQCQDGVINILALCTPDPSNDLDIESALKGPLVAIGSFEQDDTGVPCISPVARCGRIPKAPFCPKDKMSEGDYEDLAMNFEKLSAVWMLRVASSGAEGTLFLNPNAPKPVPADLVNMIEESCVQLGD
jgi:hypothetical protein